MMNALPLFPQMPQQGGTFQGLAQNAGQFPVAGGSEAGDMPSFDTLFAQSIQLEGGDVGSGSVHAAPAGSFEDVSVIMQLLRTTQQSGNMGAAAAAGANLLRSNDLDGEAPASMLESLMPPPNAEEVAAGPNAPLPLEGRPLLAQMMSHALGVQKLVDPKAATPQSPSFAPQDDSQSNDAPASPGNQAEGEVTTQLPLTADSISLPISTLQASVQLPTVLAAGPNPQSADALAATPVMESHPSAAPASAPMLSAKTARPQNLTQWQAQNSEGVMPSVSASARAPTPHAAPVTAPTTSAAMPSAAPTVDAGAAMQVMFHQSAPTQSLSATEAAAAPARLSDQILDFSNDDAWIDQLAKDIAATKSGTGDISFRLMPRHLGRIDVAMNQNEHGISVRVEAQHENAAAIVSAAQGRLADELRQQGVRVTQTEVTHQPSDAGRQSLGRDHQGRDPQGQQSRPDHFIETASDRLPDTPRGDKDSKAQQGRFA